LRLRLRPHHPGAAVRRRHRPAHRGGLLPVLLHSGGFGLPPPPCPPPGPALQAAGPVGAGGHPHGAWSGMRHHGHGGHPHPRDPAGAGDRHLPPGPGDPLLSPAGGDHGPPGSAPLGARPLGWGGGPGLPHRRVPRGPAHAGGAAGLYDLADAGLLAPAQLVVAAVTLTLFLPCIAQFGVMWKERGPRVALTITGVVLLVAFGTGWSLHHAITWVGGVF